MKWVTLLIGLGRDVGTRYISQMWSMIHAVQDFVRWNLLHKQKQITVEMSVSTRSMRRILHGDLKFGAYRYCISHALTPNLRELRRTHCAALLQRFRGKKYRNTIFTDENIFFYSGKTESSEWQCMHGATVKSEKRSHRSHACIIPHL